MNNVIRGIFLFILLFVCQSSSYAQKVWTLKDCVDYALKNNISVKQNALNIDLATYKKQQSAAALLPSATASASQNYNFGRNIDPFTNQFSESNTRSNNFSLSSNVAIFQGFQLVNTLRQSRLDYSSSQLDVQKLMNDISVNVVTAYLQILYNQELVASSQNQLDAINKQLDRTSKLVDAGTMPKGSLLDAESQVATEELNLVTAQNQLDLAYLSLVQLLDLPSVKDFRVEDPKLSEPAQNLLDKNPEAVYAYAVENQPDVKSADIKLKSAELGLTIARGAYAPRFYLTGTLNTLYSDRATTSSYRNSFSTIPVVDLTTGAPTNDGILFPQTTAYDTQQTSFREQLNNNFSKSIGFSLSIPIFNALQTRTAVNRARINMENAALSRQSTRLQLNKTIQQSYADANASLKKYNSTLKSVTSLTEALKYSEQKFNVGLLNSLDYLTAKNNLIRVQASLLQAKYDYIFKVKILDFYMGQPLTF